MGLTERELENLSSGARRTYEFFNAAEKRGFGWIFKLVTFGYKRDPYKDAVKKIQDAVTDPPESSAERRLDEVEKLNSEILKRLRDLENDVERLKQR